MWRLSSRPLTFRFSEMIRLITKSVSLFLKVTPVVLLVLLVYSCSSQPSWTDEELDNLEHFFRSAEADQEAVRIGNQGPAFSAIPEEDVQQMLEHLKLALREAKLIKDSVLDKAHPELREHFRDQYQKSLELKIKNLEDGDVTAEIIGSTLHDQWVDWINAHNKEIKIPKRH
jgi:hypothetical protein